MIQNLFTCGKIHSCVLCGQSTELCSHSHHPHDCFLCPLTAVHVSCLSFSIMLMYTCLPIHTPCIYTGHCHLPYLVVLITVCLSDRRSNDEHSRATLGPPPCSPLTSCVSLSILFNLCASIYSFLKWDNSTICSIGSLTGSLTQCLASRKSSRIISSVLSSIITILTLVLNRDRGPGRLNDSPVVTQRFVRCLNPRVLTTQGSVY